MPKEIIRDGADQFHVIVGWQRDCDVQVGIQTSDGRPIGEHLTVTEADDNGVTISRPAGFDSLWGSLNRAALNELIRVLRKARDAAYGRDE